MSITNIIEKIKHFLESEKGKDVFTIIIVILVGLGSFGLGRLSKEVKNEGLTIEYVEKEANIIKAQNEAQIGLNQTKGSFFASSKGSKYYPKGCSAGKTIKEENRIYFETREGAESAGYELSSSCR